MVIQKSIFLLSFVILVIHSSFRLINCRLQPIVEQDGSIIDKQMYIVHVQKARGTKFVRFSDRLSWYKSFLPNYTLDSGMPLLVYAYRHVISGFAARLSSEEVKAMEKMEGFLLAYPDIRISAYTTYSPRFLGLDQWSGFWPDSALGQGQVIGVVDSGIKPTHPSFHDNGGLPTPPAKWAGHCYWGKPICNNKLIGAVGYTHGRSISPVDNMGHGTHCAGTAVGSFVSDANVLGQAMGTASGTAPNAHLAMYKVLDMQGNVHVGDNSDVLKGIDEAIRNQVDILSMSLGTTNTSIPESSVCVGSFAAVKKGIVPVAASGNEGPFPSILANDAPWLLTVGASNIDRRIRVIIRLGNGKEFYGESAYQPDNFTTQQLPLVYPGTAKTTDAIECTNGSLDKIDVKGKIVLCRIGLSTNIDELVRSAGGAGLIFMNPPESGNTTYADPNMIPTANIGFDDAKDLLKNYFEKEANPTAALLFNGTQMNVRPAPTLASFSSRGPSLHNCNIIKPDVIAPGVNILSAWPFEVGPNANKTTKTFKFESGTSMATPHVAGIVALLKNNHPDWSPAVIKSALMTTAYVVDRDGKHIQDEYKGEANVFGMGAGHVDPVAANDPGLVYDIELHDYIAYLCGCGFTDSEVSAIVRGTVQCAKISKIEADQLNYPSIALYLGASSDKTIKRTLRNVGDASSTYRVKFNEPEGVSMDVTPAVLQFNKEGEELSYEVKFSLKSGFTPRASRYSEGQLAWDSGKHYVRSPVAVTFK